MRSSERFTVAGILLALYVLVAFPVELLSPWWHHPLFHDNASRAAAKRKSAVPGLTTNFASQYLGATVVTTHEACQGGSAVLSENVDKYMICPCTARRKLFVVQLVRDVEVRIVMIRNVEHFSGGVRNFTLLGSRTYPTTKWEVLGRFEAAHVRGRQYFEVAPHAPVRFVKFLWVTSHGSEPWCTMTAFQVYGIDVLETLTRYDVDEEELEEVATEATSTTTAATAAAPLADAASTNGPGREPWAAHSDVWATIQGRVHHTSDNGMPVGEQRSVPPSLTPARSPPATIDQTRSIEPSGAENVFTAAAAAATTKEGGSESLKKKAGSTNPSLSRDHAPALLTEVAKKAEAPSLTELTGHLEALLRGEAKTHKEHDPSKTTVATPPMTRATAEGAAVSTLTSASATSPALPDLCVEVLCSLVFPPQDWNASSLCLWEDRPEEVGHCCLPACSAGYASPVASSLPLSSSKAGKSLYQNAAVALLSQLIKQHKVVQQELQLVSSREERTRDELSQTRQLLELLATSYRGSLREVSDLQGQIKALTAETRVLRQTVRLSQRSSSSSSSPDGTSHRWGAVVLSVVACVLSAGTFVLVFLTSFPTSVMVDSVGRRNGSDHLGEDEGSPLTPVPPRRRQLSRLQGYFGAQ